MEGQGGGESVGVGGIGKEGEGVGRWRWRREGSDVGRGKWELREHAARKGEFDFVVIAHNGRSGRGQGREG